MYKKLSFYHFEMMKIERKETLFQSWAAFYKMIILSPNKTRLGKMLLNHVRRLKIRACKV